MQGITCDGMYLNISSILLVVIFGRLKCLLTRFLRRSSICWREVCKWGFAGRFWRSLGHCFWTKNWNAQHWHLDHQILFAKLEDYGIHDVALQWFKSYFSCHQQFFQFNQACSPMQTIKCGVPQGSISGLSRSCTAHKSTHDVLTIPGFNNENVTKNYKITGLTILVVFALFVLRNLLLSQYSSVSH